MMLRARYAGSGKSFIGKHLQMMGYNYFIRCPSECAEARDRMWFYNIKYIL